MNQRLIPYTVIGGYLGAGKTTLLNNLLRNSGGLRLAILVNDFGDINIDADLIASHDGETAQLANGCICCSLADGFVRALARLRDHADRLDHIIVEASGVSDPVKVGHYGTALQFDLAGVIVLVDAEQIREKAANKYVGDTVVRQLQGADLLVLNKADLVTSEQLAAVRTWLGAVAPGARMIETTFGQAPPEVLLGFPAGTRPDVVAGHESNPAGLPEDHADVYRSWSISLAEPLATSRLGQLLDELPDAVFRAKGFAYLAEDPSHRYLLQLVGKRRSLVRDEPWGEATPQTRLVFIGMAGSFEDHEVTAALIG